MRILILIYALWTHAAFADTNAINKILNRAELSKDNYSLYIKNISKQNVVFSYNEQKAFNPASVMKLVTTYAGLQLLGPQFQWKTEVLYKGAIKNKWIVIPHKKGRVRFKVKYMPRHTFFFNIRYIRRV